MSCGCKPACSSSTPTLARPTPLKFTGLVAPDADNASYDVPLNDQPTSTSPANLGLYVPYVVTVPLIVETIGTFLDQTGAPIDFATTKIDVQLRKNGVLVPSFFTRYGGGTGPGGGKLVNLGTGVAAFSPGDELLVVAAVDTPAPLTRSYALSATIGVRGGA